MFIVGGFSSVRVPSTAFGNSLVTIFKNVSRLSLANFFNSRSPPNPSFALYASRKDCLRFVNLDFAPFGRPFPACVFLPPGSVPFLAPTCISLYFTVIQPLSPTTRPILTLPLTLLFPYLPSYSGLRLIPRLSISI